MHDVEEPVDLGDVGRDVGILDPLEGLDRPIVEMFGRLAAL